MKWALIFCAVAIVFMVIVLSHHRHAYRLTVEVAEERCNFLALSDPDVGLEADQIDCKLVHHDILMTLRVNKSSDYYVDCLTTDSLLGGEAPRDCTIYRRQ